MTIETIKELNVIDSRFGQSTVMKSLELLESGELGTEMIDRMISFSSVLKSGKFKVNDYINGVRYCTYRAVGMSREKSWKATFPERCFTEQGEEKPYGTISASASIYDKNDIVQLILAQSQIPLHIMFMSERVQAAGVLADLMMNSENERIQMESADKFLSHVQLPEVVKIELDITAKADDTLKDIGSSLDNLAKFAQAKIIAGVITPREVIEQ